MTFTLLFHDNNLSYYPKKSIHFISEFSASLDYKKPPPHCMLVEKGSILTEGTIPQRCTLILKSFFLGR